MRRNIIVVSLLIILAALTRFIPHGYNFTPIAGMALLGGAYFNKKHLAFLVPLITLFFTDFILNNTLYRVWFPDHEGLVFFSEFMLYTYLGTAAIVILGILLLKKISGTRLLGSAISSSIVFFLITNFGSWITNPVYPKNIAGLTSSYIAGLPFMSGHLISAIVYSFILFTAYELVVNKSARKVYSLA